MNNEAPATLLSSAARDSHGWLPGTRPCWTGSGLFFLCQALVLADDKGQPAYKQSNMRILTGSIEICKVLKLLSMLERNAPYAAQEDPTLSSFSTGF